MKTWAILLAAGQGSRLQCAGVSQPKQFLEYKGLPLFWHSARTLARLPGLGGIVFVFPPADKAPGGAVSGDEFLPHYQWLIRSLEERTPLGVAWALAQGGETRQDSVFSGLSALPASAESVLVHDSARPFVSASLVHALAQALAEGHNAVIPGLLLTDTVKCVNPEQRVVSTPDRAGLRAVQTPQAFRVPLLTSAHAAAQQAGFCGTDDASLVERLGLPVLVIPGEAGNVKITTPDDLALLAAEEQPMPTPCTVFGYDVHRYGGTRPFILGGVPIATDITIEAHSDGDVLLHALIDALLGCMAAGDIGGLFPDSDPAFANISSGLLLSEVLCREERAGLVIAHVDLTIVAQVPKVAPHRVAIAKNVANLLQLPLSSVSVKATTEEHLGFTGEKKGIKAVAVVTATRQPQSAST